jgi:cystathionine beta-lyase family protein involved in aluminum resistance
MMECPKGSACKESTHTVTTFDKAVEWFNSVSASDLPITIEQRKSSDGRLMVWIENCKGEFIHKRG